MGLTFRLGQVPLAIFTDSSNNVGIGAAANASYKLQVTGTTNLTGALTGTTGTFSDIMDITANNSTAINLVLRGRAADSVGQMEFWNNAKSTRYGYIATDSTAMSIVTTQAIPLILGTNSAEKLRITSAGNVGIGTSSPNGVSANRTSVDINGTNESLLGFSNGGTLRAYIYNTATDQIYWTEGSRNMQFGIATGSGFMGFGTNNTERMRITSGGDVGIGTTSPNKNGVNRALTVNASSGTSMYELCVGDTSTTTYWQFTGTDSSLINVANGYLRFGTADTERMRITSSGKIQINGTLGIGGVVQVFNDSATGINIMNSSNAGGLMAFQNVNAVQIGSISTNNSTTSYNTTSDYRLKEDLKEIKGLEKISAIKVYDYKWKSCEERMDGVLAHELQEVIPYAVTGEKDAVNENGNIMPQGVDYSKIVPVLVKAIQELKAEIDELKNK